MQRMTALEFVLCGISLVLLSHVRKETARVLALIALSIAALVALEYALHVDLGIDQLLGRDYVHVRTSSPGRMSPMTALGFLVTGLALAALSTRKPTKYGPAIAGILGSMVAAIGAMGVFAYLLGNQEAYGWAQLSRAGLLTVAGLVLVGIGTFALAWQETGESQTLPRWLPISIGLGLGAGTLGLWQALMVHRESQLPMLSYIILGIGIAGASLIAIAVSQAQKIRLRSRQLQEGKEAFERLFEASPDALLVIDHEGRIVRANQRTATIFGYACEELMGQSIENLVPENLRDLHRAHRQGYYSNPGTRPMGEGLNLNARRKDGSEFPVDVLLSPLHSRGKLQVLAAVRDITERRRAEEALRESEERFRSVFEISPIGLALIRPDYRLAKANASLSRMSGYSEAELTGKTPFDFTHPEDLQKSMAFAQSLFKGEIPFYQIEKRYVKKSGEIIWATMTATILRDQQGRPLLGLGMMEDITERKEAQEALRQSEERFRGLVEQGPIGIALMDRDYRLLKANEALCRMLGYSPSELLGKSPLDFTHPDDRQATIDLTERLFVAQVPMRKLEKRYLKKNGEVIWANVTASLIHDQQGKPLYAMGMIEDITERKRAEEELHALTQRLALATRSASIAVWEWNLVTGLGIWDDMMFQIFGIPKKTQITREDWAHLILPDDLAKTEGFLSSIVRSKTQHAVEFRIVRPDRSLRYLSALGGAAVDKSGGVTGVVGIAMDITERKQLEQDLETARAQAITSARISALGTMAGGVAHEINNPLAIIHTMASDLTETAAEQESVQPQVVAHKSGVILQTAERIAKIVKSLRQISREGASDPFRPTPLAKIVAETLEICQAKFKANNVELILPRAIPELIVPCREVQLAQALLNLLQNAFDAVLEQEGERWVRLEVEEGHGSVVVSVIDSGPGIPPKLRSRIMEPFFTTKPVGKGTGLGLSLSKTIAEDHGGSLEYSTDHGHTRFSLVLPLAAKAEAA
jgi:PAS domain S-box-containing protein